MGRGRAAPQAQAGVPDEVVFETKTVIALGLLEQALAQDIPRGIALADAGYGVRYGVPPGGDGARSVLRYGRRTEWPVCPISETATPRRMGAALTYSNT